MYEDVAIAILPDHPTPCALRTHTHDAVPFMIYHPHGQADGIPAYDEEHVKNGSLGTVRGDEFIKALLGKQ